MRRCACRHRQARSCACVRCSVRDGVRARRHTADASKASRQSHLTASPVYESSEGGEESAYDDRMSLEHLCGDVSCGACACTPSIRSQLRAGGGKQSLHLLLTRRWAQMEFPPQSTQMLLTRLCSQMEAPPQSLQTLLCR